MKRISILPTLFVLIAAAVMVALGVWQLQRLTEKEALIARAAANLGKPVIPLPLMPGNDTLFRRVAAFCIDTGAWRAEAGRASDGTSGYRHIVECRTGAEGPGVLVEMGVAADPRIKPQFRSGPVTGTLIRAPGSATLIDRLGGTDVKPRPMIVAETPAPGLKPSRRPDPASMPNNHLAYALQWFFFAAASLVIYILASRRRSR